MSAITTPATSPTPGSARTGVTQVRTARPRTMAVHDPHWPRPHPNFGPRSPRSSLRT